LVFLGKARDRRRQGPNIFIISKHGYSPPELFKILVVVTGNVAAARSIFTFILLYGGNQRRILRDRRPSTAACPACWAMGTKE